MKKLILCFFSVLITLTGLALFPNNVVEAATPVNGNATRKAKDVLNYIYSLSGNYTLSGQHDKPGDVSSTFNNVKNITGKYPGLWGSDLGFASSGLDTMNNRQGVVNEAKNKWASGSLVTLTWHMIRPQDNSPNTFEGSVKGHPLTNNEWSQIVTPGTTLYNQFITRIDEAVPYLKQLRDADVPVLWRPFHEMNGNWFWWGGNTTYSKKLYQIMYDRYSNTHGLNNLIWVWNVDRPSNGAPASYYPGSDYVDILSMDIYDNDFNSSYYNTMVSLAGSKPIALGEVGQLPTSSILSSQPKWAYFMEWTEYLTGYNSNSSIQSLYNSTKVISQGTTPFYKVLWNQITSHTANITFDSQNSNYFESWPTRVIRSSATNEEIVWNQNSMSSFKLYGYYWNSEAVSHFSFYTSSNGTSWSQASPAITGGSGTWQSYVYTLSGLSNVNYVKVRWNNTSGQSWSPQIAAVTIN
ncbi:glycosyl hydrolase [Paenibacillus sp. FSL F4-0125]|uniref:glycosyl hydrolase n=1 Tax=Paenibacillus sp. FSL F4-0125 TaxID=2954730 RepID=UPI0030F9FE75